MTWPCLLVASNSDFLGRRLATGVVGDGAVEVEGCVVVGLARILQALAPKDCVLNGAGNRMLHLDFLFVLVTGGPCIQY